MKRLSFLPIIVIFSLIPVSALAAQKITPGSTCKVLNQKVVYQNKTYTCTKSGKKLIWNKGVMIKLSSSPVAGVCPPPSAADKTEISKLRANALITMSEDLAEQCAASLDWEYRVGERDGELFAGTKDYNPSRVTVVIKAGVITGVLVG